MGERSISIYLRCARVDVRLCDSVNVKADAADRRGLPAGQPVTVRRSGRTPGIGAGPRAAQAHQQPPPAVPYEQAYPMYMKRALGLSI